PLYITVDPSYRLSSPATPEVPTLSLHDALPIYADLDHRLHLPGFHIYVGKARRLAGGSHRVVRAPQGSFPRVARADASPLHREGDRKSTRLNSSHVATSYAVFCLKKKTTELARL